VMAAIELRAGARFAVASFTEFLAEQHDLGTKWSPRFIRIIEEMPLTANNKVNKQPLRAACWNTSDVIWWQPTRGADYRIFNASDAAALAAEFAEHHRTQLLPR
jgi:fatty-acyl-CoA synthase